MLSERTYWVGFVLNILLPGLGFFVIREWKWGSIWLGVAILSTVAGFEWIPGGALVVASTYHYTVHANGPY